MLDKWPVHCTAPQSTGNLRSCSIFTRVRWNAKWSIVSISGFEQPNSHFSAFIWKTIMRFWWVMNYFSRNNLFPIEETLLAYPSLLSCQMFRRTTLLRSTRSDLHSENPSCRIDSVESFTFPLYFICKEEVSPRQIFSHEFFFEKKNKQTPVRILPRSLRF